MEGPNGQSYIIVRANETPELTVPMPMEYSSIVNDGVIGGSSIFLQSPVASGQECLNGKFLIIVSRNNRNLQDCRNICGK